MLSTNLAFNSPGIAASTNENILTWPGVNRNGAMSNNNAAMTDVKNDAGMVRNDRDTWSRGGRQFASPREVYTRALYRICLKFTTSEDEDEGKPEPATAYWTLYGRATTIGNGPPSSPTPDDICRRMDDSMTGPAAGILARLTDADGEQAALHALRAMMTSGWHIRGDRGDAAIRVGKAKVYNSNNTGGEETQKEARLLSLDAERWILCKGSSFAAGNSVFNVEDVNEARQKNYRALFKRSNERKTH